VGDVDVEEFEEEVQMVQSTITTHLFLFSLLDLKDGVVSQLRDTTSRLVAHSPENLGLVVFALSLFLQPKHGAFNNGSKTLSSS
jgi:hypothetical protein